MYAVYAAVADLKALVPRGDALAHEVEGRNSMSVDVGTNVIYDIRSVALRPCIVSIGNVAGT